MRHAFRHQRSAIPNHGAYAHEAAVWIEAVEAADGQPLEEGVQAAAHQLIASFKLHGYWRYVDNLFLLAGPRTAAGAKIPVRGKVPCEFNEANATHERAFGFRGKDGTGWHIDSKVPANSLPLNNAAVVTYFGEWQYHRTYVLGATGLVTGGLCVRCDNALDAHGHVPTSLCLQGDVVNYEGTVIIGRAPLWFGRHDPHRVTMFVGSRLGGGRSETTTNNVTDTILIGSAPGATAAEAVTAYIPYFFTVNGGTFSSDILSHMSYVYRMALQEAVPPSQKPSVPKFKAGYEPFWNTTIKGACFWLDGDIPLAADYRIYVDGHLLPILDVAWQAHKPGFTAITHKSAVIGSTVEVAAWNGAGETRSAPVVIASGTKPV